MASAPFRTLVPLLAALSALAPAARAQWSSDPFQNLAVADRSGSQVLPKIASTSDGGVWIGWFDNASGNYDVYVQRLDSAGVEQFPHNGLLVSAHPSNTSLVDWDLIADAQDNAVLAFSDARAGSDLDVYAYRISSSGQFLWGPDGVTLSANADFEPAPKVARTSDGKFVFVWARLPSGADGTIVMQKLDGAGSPQFGASGIPFSGAAGEDPAFCDVVAAESGGFIVSYVRDISSFQSPRHVRARKFDAGGAPLWGPVAVFDQASVPIAHLPIAQPDGAGGAFFCWHASVAGVFESFVQHLDASGSELFPHNGVSVSTEPGRHDIDPTLSQLPGGDVAVFWNSRDLPQGQRGLSGQRISAAGARLWGMGGIALLPVDGVIEDRPRSVPYDDGALVFLFQDERVVGLRVDGSGQAVWSPTPAAVGSTPGSKDDLVVARHQSGFVQMAWSEARSDPSDVFAQNVNPDGSLGFACGVASYCTAAPNSAGPGGTLAGTGGTSVAANDFGLAAGSLPPSKAGLFFAGARAQEIPFFGGYLCAGGTLRRFGFQFTTPAGTAAFAIDNTAAPFASGPTAIAPGVTRFFQFWHRDSGGTTNTTLGLRADFCP